MPHPLDFPDPLKYEIQKLWDLAKTDGSNEQGGQKYKKKAMILDAALNAFPAKSETEVWPLSNPGIYEFNPKTNAPDYFSKMFKQNNVNVLAEPPDDPYGYSKYPGAVWVDFAAYNLGGGVFGKGMLQEETMALSMPELADAAAIGYHGYHTRSYKEGALGSNPTPLVLTKVHRTIALDPALYKDGWVAMTVKEVREGINSLNPSEVANILNVLAVAVPKLKDKDPKMQTDPATLADLFNTFDAAYELANKVITDAHLKDNRINTGPIGTGDFNHHREVIYVMQYLAALHVGVNLRYWYEPNHQAYDKVANEINNKFTGKTISDMLGHAHDYFQNNPPPPPK